MRHLTASVATLGLASTVSGSMVIASVFSIRGVGAEAPPASSDGDLLDPVGHVVALDGGRLHLARPACPLLATIGTVEWSAASDDELAEVARLIPLVERMVYRTEPASLRSPDMSLVLHNDLMEVRPLNTGDRVWVAETTSNEWGLPIVSISGLHNPAELAGFVAIEADQRLGLITYRITDEDCEVVTLNSLRPSRGTGTSLLHAVKDIADERGLRLWLITTDENSNAIRFYENRGMTKRALHRDFIKVVRRYKPDSGGYRDAIEFSF